MLFRTVTENQRQVNLSFSLQILQIKLHLEAPENLNYNYLYVHKRRHTASLQKIFSVIFLTVKRDVLFISEIA